MTRAIEFNTSIPDSEKSFLGYCIAPQNIYILDKTEIQYANDQS